MGCGLVSGAPAGGGGVYGGCAFSEAAAMAATVTRLEAELAHAKGALADRVAGEEAWQRQRRALEADVARLHAEVPSILLKSAVQTCKLNWHDVTGGLER